MPTIYPPSVHGVHRVSASFDGMMGASVCVTVRLHAHDADGEDAIEIPLFFPPECEAEARRVVAALNGRPAQ